VFVPPSHQEVTRLNGEILTLRAEVRRLKSLLAKELRDQKPASTDPDRLERMAQETER
jgi:hypothetical protein